MKTEEWFRTRVPLAEQAIRMAQQRGRLDLGALHDAMREITSKTPSADDARLLAQALGALRTDELLCLLHEAAHQLERESSYAAERGERVVKERHRDMQDAGPSAAPLTVADIRTEAPPQGSAFLWIGALLQSLAWALDLPKPHVGLVSD